MAVIRKHADGGIVCRSDILPGRVRGIAFRGVDFDIEGFPANVRKRGGWHHHERHAKRKKSHQCAFPDDSKPSTLHVRTLLSDEMRLRGVPRRNSIEALRESAYRSTSLSDRSGQKASLVPER